MVERVLIAHNFYRERGGEDAVFLNEKQLVESRGVEVISYERHNRDIPAGSLMDLAGHARSMAWSTGTYRELTKLIRKHRPQLAHFHNTFQLISPSAYAACHDNGVAVVQTLHNYRLVCPGGLLQRDGVPCERCVGKAPLPAIRYRCYRHSLAATAAVSWMLISNRRRGTYQRRIDRYIALTEFAAARFRAGGLPADRIRVKPNFLPDPPAAGPGGGGYALYVGRLSPEKGIRSLLTAWRKLRNIPLRILGDGPLADEVSAAAEGSSGAIQWLGYQPQSRIAAELGKAEFLVMPSECYEGFPMSVLEACACGTPVLASRLGSLDEIVVEGRTGFKFEAGNPADLAARVRDLWRRLPALQAMRPEIRAHFDSHYTAELNYRVLESIYHDAIEAMGKA